MDEKSILISVIVPVYKAEKSIVFCVNSILNQEYENFELILVDDGSPDGSGRICDELSILDHRIQVIHKKNEGVSVARNTGINHANGKYIVFIDSDDYIEITYLQELVEAKEMYKNVGHIWCEFQAVAGFEYENKKINNVYQNEYQQYSYKNIMTLHQMWIDAMPWNKLFELEILNKYNIRFLEGLSLGEDLLFNWKYLDKHSNKEIILITKPLYNYVRDGSDSLDTGYRKNLLEMYQKVYEGIKQYLVTWELFESEK